MAQLSYSDAAGQQSVLELSDREVLIGRLAECDIVIAKGFVSRRHARVFNADGRWTVEDLNSSHGTYVNRLRVNEKVLEPGDQIQIGDEVIQFQDATDKLRYKDGSTARGVVTTEDKLGEDDNVVHSQPVESGDIMRTVLGAQVADLTKLTSSPERSVAQLIHKPEEAEAEPAPAEQQQALRDDANVARNLSMVFNVAADLRRCTDISGACRIAITKAMEVVNADRGVIALREDEESPFVPQIQLSNDTQDTANTPVRVSHTMIDRVVAAREARLSFDTAEDSALSAARSIVAQSIRSIICAPLWDGQNILGYIYLDSSEAGRLREDHLDLINAIGYLAAAEVARLRAIRQLREEEFQRKSLSRFFSSDVVTHILEEAKAGRLDPTTAHRQQVTILFADICGFTRMSEQMTAEHVKVFLNTYFEVMSKVLVEKHRGALDKFIGDAIMALYGAPFSQGVQADAVRAIAAAVEMQQSVARLRLEDQDLFGNLRIRIGINTGMVVAGYIGPDWAMQYSVLGDSVNVASRLETTAKPDHIQIGAETYNLVKDAFECEFAGERHVKNRDEPVRTYYVLGARGG